MAPVHEGHSGRVARRYVVHGAVQGVGYRAFVWRRAAELGLSGWVRNRRDGTVEVLAVGDSGRLDALERHLRNGPPLARVDGIEVENVADPAPITGFSVEATH